MYHILRRMASSALSLLGFAAVVFAVVRIAWFFFGRHMTPGRLLREKYKFLVVLGSGGHTSEMLMMLKQFREKMNRIDVTFLVAQSDSTSVPRIAAVLGDEFPHRVIRVPRIRHVGESVVWAVLRMPIVLAHSIKVVAHVDPDVLIVNGPGTCIPTILAACIVQIFPLAFKRIFCVFVESFCRVKTISLSGKIAYPFVDKFIVQWPPSADIVRKYPRVIYRGPLL